MDIIFYGGHKWDNGPWFRKQQFASRLAERGNRVFYIEETVSMIRKNNSKNAYFQTVVKNLNDNLKIIIPSCYFPFPRNRYSRQLYNTKLSYDLKNIIKEYNIRDYIFWNNRPEFCSGIPKMNGLQVFDLADDIPYYFKLANDEKGYLQSSQYLKDSFTSADVVIVSAHKLKEKYQPYCKNNIIVIPNGYDKIVFQSKNKPSGLASIKKPIIGFIGTLFRFIDDDLLEYLAANCPDYQFVFLGKTESNFPIERIRKYDNVSLIGHVNKDEVSSYIQHFDVCINPFKVHEVNDSVSPVKVFEYLALQKNVVSTSMYSLMKEEISRYILFASNYEEFKCLLQEIIKKGKVNNVPAEVLNKYSWDNLFNSLIHQINTVGGYKL